MSHIPYTKTAKNHATTLRKNMTKQEKHLWYDFLSKYEVRFNRQKPLGVYIADFYCHKARLVIEVDGAQHYTEEGKQHDAMRTKALEEQGIEILRFSNSEIEKNFYAVCLCIDQKVKER